MKTLIKLAHSLKSVQFKCIPSCQGVPAANFGNPAVLTRAMWTSLYRG